VNGDIKNFLVLDALSQSEVCHMSYCYVADDKHGRLSHYKSAEERYPILKFAEPYDNAIPQPWADDVMKLTGFYPPGYIVWTYNEDISPIFGSPFPVNSFGALILRLYVECRGCW